MKNVYRNFSFSLILIISVFVGFSGDIGKIEVKRFLPYLSAKTFLILSAGLLIFALPDLVEMIMKSRKNSNITFIN